MRIPDIQKRLEEIADETGVAELRSLAANLSRRAPRRKAPQASASVDDRKREEIRQFALDNPTMTQVAIGSVFNVNQGRVSEALRGFRT